MNMTIYDFKSLSLAEQLETAWQGRFAGAREEKDYRVVLYRIDHFFAEMYYDRQHKTVIRVVPFMNRARLDLYVNHHLN